MSKNKKILIIIGVCADLIVTLFLFVLSIIFIAVVGRYGVQDAPNHVSGFLVPLMKNPTIYGLTCVVPLFLLLALNIILLVIYVKKTAAKENAPTKLDDLSEEQKEALRQELLRDLMKSSNKEEPENNKEE